MHPSAAAVVLNVFDITRIYWVQYGTAVSLYRYRPSPGTILSLPEALWVIRWVRSTLYRTRKTLHLLNRAVNGPKTNRAVKKSVTLHLGQAPLL